MPSVEERTGAGAVRSVLGVSAGGFALGCSNMDTWVGTGREIEQHSVFRGAGPCLIGRMKRKGCERARDF